MDTRHPEVRSAREPPTPEDEPEDEIEACADFEIADRTALEWARRQAAALLELEDLPSAASVLRLPALRWKK